MRPPFAYIPGQTPRHPEALFDPLKADVAAGMTPEELAKTTCFQTALSYLDEGYFWEAHELFEPVWMVLQDQSDERRFVQALIQLANGRLKVRMGRDSAAQRLAGIVIDLCRELESQKIMGLYVSNLVLSAKALLASKK